MSIPHRPGSVRLSRHADSRLRDRALTIGEIFAVIGAGRVYEPPNQNAVTYWGRTDDGRSLGVVVSRSGTIVTLLAQRKGIAE